MATHDVSKQGSFEPFEGVKIVADYSYSYISGTKTSITIGDYNNIKLGAYIGLTAGLKLDVSLASKWSIDVLLNKWSFERIYMGENATEVTAAKKELAVAKIVLAEAEMKLVQTKLAATGEKVEIIETAVNSISTELVAKGNEIRAVVTEVGDVGTKVNNVGNDINTIATVVAIVGTAVIEHTAKIETNTAHIADNDVAIFNSGILMLD